MRNLCFGFRFFYIFLIRQRGWLLKNDNAFLEMLAYRDKVQEDTLDVKPMVPK